MHKQKSIIGGLILIIVGACILLAQIPAFSGVLDLSQQWPLFVIGLGGLFLIGAFWDSPELAIPGCIIAGLGLIFYYQTLTGNWTSWAYMWALIPGFVGIGMFVTSSLDKTRSELRAEGTRLVLVSAGLFLVFGIFFNLAWSFVRFWPALLIGVGLWLLIRNRRANNLSK